MAQYLGPQATVQIEAAWASAQKAVEANLDAMATGAENAFGRITRNDGHRRRLSRGALRTTLES